MLRVKLPAFIALAGVLVAAPLFAAPLLAAAPASASTGLPASLADLSEVSFPQFTSNGTTFSYDDQDVTFTGTADIAAPGGSPQPFSNATLELVDSNEDSTPVTTAADGTFSVTVPAATASYEVEYPGDATTGIATSAPIAVTVIPLTAQLSAKLTVPHPRQGQADEVTGTITYTDGSVTKPLANSKVGLYSPYTYYDGGPPPTVTAVTNAKGQYSVRIFTGSTADIGQWTVGIDRAYFAPAGVRIYLTIAFPNYISDFSGALSPFGVVALAGCTAAPAGNYTIQYAAKASGPWRSLGRWTPYQGDTCELSNGSVGFVYATAYAAKLPAAYYRAVYPGSYTYEPVTSVKLYLAKRLTKITGFKVSPTTVHSGSKFKVTGRLMAKTKTGKWAAYAHKRIWIFFYYQGTYYYYKAHPATNGNGYFSGKFPVAVTAPVFAQYNGDSTHFASASNRIRVDMTGTPARTPNLLSLGIGLRIARTPAVPRWLG